MPCLRPRRLGPVWGSPLLPWLANRLPSTRGSHHSCTRGTLVHALFQLDISDHYITPRGLNVENEGVIFQPLFLVFWNLYSDKDAGFLTDVTLTTGVWSSIHTHESGADPGYWNEFDPILGLTFKFAGGFTLDTTFTSFESMVDSYPTSTHFEAKLSFDDSKYLGKFA